MTRRIIFTFRYNPSISNRPRIPPRRPGQTQRLRTITSQITRELPYYGFVDTETTELAPFVEKETYTFLSP